MRDSGFEIGWDTLKEPLGLVNKNHPGTGGGSPLGTRPGSNPPKM